METVIETRELTKCFGGRGRRSPQPQRAHGRHLALLGDNGAGKTTTMRMLTGLLPPTPARPRSSARIAGGRRRPAAARRLRARAAALLRLDDGRRDRLVRRRLPRRGYLARFERMDANVPSSTASAAQKAVEGPVRQGRPGPGAGRRPEVLILDEPTSGLDLLVRARVPGSMVEPGRRGTDHPHLQPPDRRGRAHRQPRRVSLAWPAAADGAAGRSAPPDHSPAAAITRSTAPDAASSGAVLERNGSGKQWQAVLQDPRPTRWKPCGRPRGFTTWNCRRCRWKRSIVHCESEGGTMKGLGATGSLPARAGGGGCWGSHGQTSCPWHPKIGPCADLVAPSPCPRGEKAGVRGDSMPRENLTIVHTAEPSFLLSPEYRGEGNTGYRHCSTNLKLGGYSKGPSAMTTAISSPPRLSLHAPPQDVGVERLPRAAGDLVGDCGVGGGAVPWHWSVWRAAASRSLNMICSLLGRLSAWACWSWWLRESCAAPSFSRVRKTRAAWLFWTCCPAGGAGLANQVACGHGANLAASPGPWLHHVGVDWVIGRICRGSSSSAGWPCYGARWPGPCVIVCSRPFCWASCLSSAISRFRSWCQSGRSYCKLSWPPSPWCSLIASFAADDMDRILKVRKDKESGRHAPYSWQTLLSLAERQGRWIVWPGSGRFFVAGLALGLSRLRLAGGDAAHRPHLRPGGLYAGTKQRARPFLGRRSGFRQGVFGSSKVHSGRWRRCHGGPILIVLYYRLVLRRRTDPQSTWDYFIPIEMSAYSSSSGSSTAMRAANSRALLARRIVVAGFLAIALIIFLLMWWLRSFIFGGIQAWQILAVPSRYWLPLE